MAAMDLRAESRQHQTLSPKLQHAVRLLQLSSIEFAQHVRDALDRNPFLDLDENDADDTLVSSGGTPAAVEPCTAGDAPAGEWKSSADSSESDREIWYADGFRPDRRGGDDEDPGMLERASCAVSLAGHLHAQLAGLPDRERLLARVVIESLDDDGYLRTGLDELTTLVDLDPQVSRAEVEQALHRVQGLEPAGVAARSVAECLLLQMQAIACPEARALAERIVGEHLQCLAARDVKALARVLGRSPAEIEHVCDRIRQFDPRPGLRFGSADVQYVIPDVIARKRRDGVWVVQLNPAVVPKVRLNGLYVDLFQRQCRRQGNSALAGHLQEARWTLSNIEQRFGTILDVAGAIVRRQQHFLNYGPMAMKPLGLREIADELGMHESTVSRVTNNKYIATAAGVFELKHFFSRAMPAAGGTACSGTAIRGLVGQMIGAESPSAPLSDAAITRQLARQGLAVARRTVTKYRQQLRIESVERRRRRHG